MAFTLVCIPLPAQATINDQALNAIKRNLTEEQIQTLEDEVMQTWTTEELSKLTEEQVEELIEQPEGRFVGVALRSILSAQKIAELIRNGLLILVSALGMEMAKVEDIAADLNKQTQHKYFVAYLDYPNKALLVGNGISEAQAKVNIKEADKALPGSLKAKAGNIYTYDGDDAYSLAYSLTKTAPDQDFKCNEIGQYKHYHAKKNSDVRYKNSHIFYFY